jgi:hypothetical protein
VLALTASACDWPFAAAPRPLSSWLSLTRPSTPRHLNDESDIGSAYGKGLQEYCFPFSALARRSFGASNTWMAGSSPAMTPRASLHVSRETGGRLR